ncbi:MAG: hypothetical protein FJW63_04085 [Actinobacteria bacterium]|nr:hypothetical protein [Actinomycetota bacterium]
MILRDLAKKVNKIINHQNNKSRINLWKNHNSLIKTKPPIVVFPENSWTEIIPYEKLKTSHLFLREYEWYLRSIIYRNDNIKDDYVYEPYLKVPIFFSSNDFGLPSRTLETEKEKGSLSYIRQINDENDIVKIKYPEVFIDEERTLENYQFLGDILGDIIDVRIVNLSSYYVDTVLLWRFNHWRGFNQICIDMIERPKWVHKVMSFMTKGSLKLLRKLEENNNLGLNNNDLYLGSGGFGYTNDLPSEDTCVKEKVLLKYMWGFSEAQDFTGVSPRMFEEFVLPYQMELIKNFGLSYYGCCEDITNKIDLLLKIPNLRRVSVSPFSDLRILSEKLEKNYVYVWKPNPSYLAMETFDEEFIRTKLREGFSVTKDNIVEIVLKDTITIRNEPERITKWVNIAKKIIEEDYN